MISNDELKQKIEDYKAGKSLMLVEPLHDHVLRLLADNDRLVRRDKLHIEHFNELSEFRHRSVEAFDAKVAGLEAEVERLKAEGLGKITIDGNEFEERDLIRRAIASLKGPSKRRSLYGIERWVLVKDLFGVGSTVARGLCRTVGLDPDEALRS